MSESNPNIKIAPNSKESEMMVLGCMLTSINALNIAADALDDSDFYYLEHKIIFSALKSAYKNDKPADVHLICEELKRQDKLKSVGGVSYVTTLAQYAGTSAYIEEYVEIIHNKSLLRRMIHASQVIEKRALEEPDDVKDALDEAQQLFFQISQSTNTSVGVLLGEVLSGVRSESTLPYLKELQERQERFAEKGPEDLGITGIPTHFVDIDKVLNGFNKSNLMILAARPAMGKTALALNIAENICFKNKIPVGIFSLEMSAEQLVHRIVCSQSEVESDKIKTGSLNGSDYQRIVASVNEMVENVMIIDDQPGLKITDLRARARRMKEKYGIEFLVIDYLQLLSGSSSSRGVENRQSEISEISRTLKNMARELNVPILCLSQLSRKVEERQGHRPMMSDLRESGCLTGDALIKDARTGKVHTIKELAERKIQTPLFVYGVNDKLKMGEYKLVKAFSSGKKNVYKLKTRTGRSIKASANHPFLKLNGWARLDQLKKGDRIGLSRQMGPKSPIKPFSDTEILFLAHLLGDGCILPRQPYHYTSADIDSIKVVSDAAEKLFGIASKVVRQSNWYHVYFPSPYRLARGKVHPITNWFNQMGIERARSYEKKVPNKVFECDSDQVSLFLRHLWSTDGNIRPKLLKGRKPSAAIYYASSSPVLSNQVQHLLLSIGIQSTITIHKSSKGYRDMYHVSVQGTPHQIRFLKNVGAIGQTAEHIPILLQQLEQIEPHYNFDVVPKEAWQTVIKEIKDKLNLTWRDVCANIQTSYCGSSLFKSGISRERMQRFYQIFKDDKMKELAESDVYWDEIISIEELGFEEVYDATVEDVHNFVANDIIVHNSIEQDADVVMFLLRREYYDPMDKPGMAELIIGKNRHGGIGNINLTYRKEISRFENHTPMKYVGSYQLASGPEFQN